MQITDLFGRDWDCHLGKKAERLVGQNSTEMTGLPCKYLLDTSASVQVTEGVWRVNLKEHYCFSPSPLPPLYLFLPGYWTQGLYVQLQPKPCFLFSVLRHSLIELSRLGSNWWSSCLSLWITGMCHHVPQRIILQRPMKGFIRYLSLYYTLNLMLVYSPSRFPFSNFKKSFFLSSFRFPTLSVWEKAAEDILHGYKGWKGACLGCLLESCLRRLNVRWKL